MTRIEIAMAETEAPLVSEPMRPSASLQRPGFDVPSGACDAHMHVFGPADRYTRVPHPHYTLPDGALPKYQDAIAALRLERFIIVQPRYYGEDNTCLLDALEAAGEAARGVTMIAEDTLAAELERQHGLGVRGLRLDLFKRAAEPLDSIQDYISRMAAKVRPLGWHLQFYAPGYVVRDLIGFFGQLDVDHVIDHTSPLGEERFSA